MQDIKANKYNLMILGNGKQRKTYIGVESLIEDMFTITELGLPGIYNLGPGDTGTSVQEICEMIRDHVSPLVSLNYQGSIGGWPGDIPVILLDVSKRNTLIPNTLPSSLNSIHKAIHEIANQFSVKIRCGN
jgi:UDP-glucose 4-epimerase